MANPKISVIIPVYKVEEYIESCAVSLFSQTLNSIEFIFIDDHSPDKSVEILLNVLEKYPKRKDQVKLISHSENYGVGWSRLDGLKASTGDYIIHCDADDWIEKNFYETILEKAIKEKADITIVDYFENYIDKEIIKRHPNIKNKEEILAKTFTNEIPPYLWNKLIKRELYFDNNIFFEKGIDFWEDAYVIPRLIYYSKKIIFINDQFYHYRRNNVKSLTKNWNLQNSKNIFKILQENHNFFKSRRINDQNFIIRGLSLIIDKEHYNIDRNLKEIYNELIPAKIDYSVIKSRKRRFLFFLYNINLIQRTNLLHKIIK